MWVCVSEVRGFCSVIGQSAVTVHGLCERSGIVTEVEFHFLYLRLSAAQATGEQCLAQFKQGQEDFVLDADESVKDGATFLSSPELLNHKDCVAACCKEPTCNVAFMEKRNGGLKYVCRFVRKKGYINYILETMYDSHLQSEKNRDNSDLPPKANGGSDQVVQPTESVTLNGNESKDDHKIDKYEWALVTSYPYAVFQSTNFPDQMIVSNLTSGEYKFKLTVTDSAGQTDSTQVTVLVLTPEQSEHHCMVPKKVGPCRGAFPRWHYNAASKACEKFIFGGCRENRNNYVTKAECMTACAGTENISKEGRGLPLFPTKVERCSVPCTQGHFTCANQCCIEKELECDGSPQCSDGSDEVNCKKLGESFDELITMNIPEKKVRCTESPDTGSCRESYSKWYYEPREQSCFPFNYGGCYGNDNRFDTEQQCKDFCKGITEKEVFEMREQNERRVSESQMGIIAIAAVLGVAIFILVAVLVYCLIKGKKKAPVQHHRVPATASEDLTVYKSTTKPI
ncbi:hypothetical protein WMY93_017604 [Mugilogobius chulae]|uniref:Low-density lipoprotein receptor-related protein 11 n=1 Tax=Mugilogobius chulae TaxID=88201 RepID=A0AAW0NZT9_9GOBI